MILSYPNTVSVLLNAYIPIILPVITTTSHYDSSSSNQNFGAIIGSVIGGVAANNIYSRKRGIYKYTY
ncbi:MAG: hypothetical protein MRQ09_00040 [Candidatus Midichloria sp.]|nr:hypothetical protein [Candidatus Midichloria sp.]